MQSITPYILVVGNAAQRLVGAIQNGSSPELPLCGEPTHERCRARPTAARVGWPPTERSRTNRPRQSPPGGSGLGGRKGWEKQKQLCARRSWLCPGYCVWPVLMRRPPVLWCLLQQRCGQTGTVSSRRVTAHRGSAIPGLRQDAARQSLALCSSLVHQPRFVSFRRRAKSKGATACVRSVRSVRSPRL